MKKFLLFFSLLNVSLSQQPAYHPHRVLFQFKSGSYLFVEARMAANFSAIKKIDGETVSSSSQLSSFFSSGKIETLQPVAPDASVEPLAGGMERIFAAELSHSVSVEDAIRQLAADPDIEYAEPDYIGYGGGEKGAAITPNDPQFGNQWGLKNTGQTIGGTAGTAGADINMVPAWDISTGDSSTLLAVLDSGLPASTPEFEGRLVPGYDYANNDSIPNDDHGHGSNVTSVAAAKGNNGNVMAGVNWKCRIMHLKILDANNSGMYSWWASALYSAADNGANVISMSVGGNGSSSTLQNAVTYAANKGCIIVACMMNTNNEVPYYPSAYPNVIAVGALNNQDKRAAPFAWGGGSNYGSHIDFVAPGNLVLGLVNTNPSQANYWSGTSQATPMVSGLVSLIVGMKKDMTFQQVYDVLKTTAKDSINSAGEDKKGWDKYFGWGKIDASAALSLVQSTYTKNVTFTTASTTIDFGNASVAFIKDSVIAVGNAGTDTLVVFNVSTTNNKFLSKPAAFKISPGGSFNDTLRFLPSPGLDSATLTFSINSAQSPVKIKLFGTGTGPSSLLRTDIAAPAFSLSQNFPNPFNPSTTIRFQIPHSPAANSPFIKGERSDGTRGIQVTLKVYDLLGKEVATVVNEHLPAGAYTVTWNARNYSSGMYFYTLQAGGRRETRKLLLLK